jgi:hypothetical protein
MIHPTTYRGERPQPTRPGASDAFKLPSLIDGKRVERRPPSAQCVGVKVFTGTTK